MKNKLLIVFAFVVIINVGCNVGNNEIRTNDFIKNNPKPIIVRYGEFSSDHSYRPMTLQSANGQILSIEYSQIFLPDTIK